MRPVNKPGITPQYSKHKVVQKQNKNQLFTLLLYFLTFSYLVKNKQKNTFSYKRLLHKKTLLC